MGDFSRNLKKICANLRRNNIRRHARISTTPYSREETMGEFFQKLGGGRKLWGNFSQKFGEDMRAFPKNNIGGRKL